MYTSVRDEMRLVLGAESTLVTEKCSLVTMSHSMLLKSSFRRKTTLTFRASEGIVTYLNIITSMPEQTADRSNQIALKSM